MTPTEAHNDSEQQDALSSREDCTYLYSTEASFRNPIFPVGIIMVLMWRTIQNPTNIFYISMI